MTFSKGLPLSLQVTLNEPATLLGTIQMAASDTRFRPDILVSGNLTGS